MYKRQSQYWGTGGKKRTDFGTYAGTTNRLHCLEAVGAGISPVNVYDELVCRETLCYLEQWEKQGEERPPLFLVAGFYGPHFPYVCEESLFLKYQERISLKDCERDMEMEPFPMYQELKQGCDPEPVSYTHLDVYKRQYLRSAYEPGGIFTEDPGEISSDRCPDADHSGI